MGIEPDHKALAQSTGSRVIDEIAEVIGVDAALRFAWAFRGQRLYIKTDHAQEPRLTEAVGENAAREIATLFGGTSLTVPMKPGISFKVRELLAAGELTRREIAQHVGISEDRVYALIRGFREEAASNQLKLL